MRIKVLHILNRLVIGGPAIVALNILKNLPENFEYKLVVGGNEDHEESSQYLFDSIKDHLIFVPEMKRNLNPINDVKSYLAIKKIIREFKPDIVHTHASKAGAIGRLAASSLNVPVVLHTFHGHVFHSYFHHWFTRFFIQTERFLAKKSTQIIAISPSQKQELVHQFRICDTEKMAVIPNGIDLQVYRDDQQSKREDWRSKLKVNNDVILVGIVGRMVPIKNHAMFVEVIQRLLHRKNSGKIKFVIVGDGDTRIDVQQKLSGYNIKHQYLPEEKLTEDTQVIFTSWETEMDKVYAGLDIVCLTSLNEGTPTSLIEAQAAKRVVVATNVGGVQDTVVENETALLSPSNEAHHFAELLQKLIDDKPLRLAMGEKGLAFVENNFDQKHMVKQIGDLYIGLLQKKTSSVSVAIVENNLMASLSIRKKLVASLMEKGYKVSILSTGTPEQLDKARALGFDVVNVGSSAQNPLGILKYILQLRRGLQQKKADVCLTFTIRPAIWGNFVTRFMGIPTITNITGLGPLFASNSITYRMARLLYRFSLKRTCKLFFQNKDDQSLFVKHKFATLRGSSIIPGSGVDHDYFSPRAMTSPFGKFVFLYIGRLLKDKGIGEYVEAARIISKKYPQALFRVAGPVWTQNLKDNTITKEHVDEWEREGVIEYLGELSDVRDAMAGCHCFVLPSYREGTSNVLLEAGSMEKPCITCDTPGCKDIVADGVTGYLCKVADANDLATKMEQMIDLDESVRLEMGRAARRKVIKEYDKKIVIDIYLNVVERYHKK